MLAGPSTSPASQQTLVAFQLSLKLQSFETNIHRLRQYYRAIPESNTRVFTHETNTKRTELYRDLEDSAAQIFSLFGDTNPVNSASIAEWFNANTNEISQTEFARRLRACRLKIDQQLSAIPSGLQKGKIGAREAFLFNPSLPLAAVLAHSAEGAGLANLADVCDPNNSEYLDSPFAPFFVLDLTGPGHSKFDEAIQNLRREALDAATYAEGSDPRTHRLAIFGDAHWLLHLVPRRSQLILPLLTPMRALVHSLVPFQDETGYWAYGGEDCAPNVFLSAGIAHSLKVFADLRLPEHNSSYTRAKGWLEGAQRKDGGWPIRRSDPDSDVLCTALVGDFIRRAGNQRAFERAVGFLIGKQNSAGLWFSGSRNSDAHNAIILEVLEKRLPQFPQFDHRLELARGLFVKSQELVHEANEISDQIALMAAHQAVEMLSYCALELLNPPGDIWEPNGQRTVGLRVALAKLDGRLRDDGLGALSYRSEMQRLAAARDDIVHKGRTVARSAVRGHLEDARRYLTAASLKTLGYDLLG